MQYVRGHEEVWSGMLSKDRGYWFGVVLLVRRFTHSSLQSAPLQSTPTLLLVLLKEPKTLLTMWENVRNWFGTAAHAFAGRPKQGTLHAAHTAKQLPWVHRHVMNADLTVCVLLVATVSLAAALVIVCITWRRERERHKKQHSLFATLQRIPPPTQAFTESPTETVIARGMWHLSSLSSLLSQLTQLISMTPHPVVSTRLGTVCGAHCLVCSRRASGRRATRGVRRTALHRVPCPSTWQQIPHDMHHIGSHLLYHLCAARVPTLASNTRHSRGPVLRVAGSLGGLHLRAGGGWEKRRHVL